MCGGILFVTMLLFIAISLIFAFTEFGRSNVGILILSGIGVLVFAIYLICMSKSSSFYLPRENLAIIDFGF